MGSVWFSKKAFLYFGGIAVILLGGLVVISSPYHYANYAVIENVRRPWTQYDASGYYPQIEISVQARPVNGTEMYLDLAIWNNITDDTTILNMTLGPEHQMPGADFAVYKYSEVIDLPAGSYTMYFVNVTGTTIIDLGLNQASDSRLWIVTGGSMNILGVVMGIFGYLVPGSFLPSDSDTIVEWGYDEEESEQ